MLTSSSGAEPDRPAHDLSESQPDKTADPTERPERMTILSTTDRRSARTPGTRLVLRRPVKFGLGLMAATAIAVAAYAARPIDLYTRAEVQLIASSLGTQGWVMTYDTIGKTSLFNRTPVITNLKITKDGTSVTADRITIIKHDGIVLEGDNLDVRAPGSGNLTAKGANILLAGDMPAESRDWIKWLKSDHVRRIIADSVTATATTTNLPGTTIYAGPIILERKTIPNAGTATSLAAYGLHIESADRATTADIHWLGLNDIISGGEGDQTISLYSKYVECLVLHTCAPSVGIKNAHIRSRGYEFVVSDLAASPRPEKLSTPDSPIIDLPVHFSAKQSRPTVPATNSGCPESNTSPSVDISASPTWRPGPNTGTQTRNGLLSLSESTITLGLSKPGDEPDFTQAAPCALATLTLDGLVPVPDSSARSASIILTDHGIVRYTYARDERHGIHPAASAMALSQIFAKTPQQQANIAAWLNDPKRGPLVIPLESGHPNSVDFMIWLGMLYNITRAEPTP